MTDYKITHVAVSKTHLKERFYFNKNKVKIVKILINIVHSHIAINAGLKIYDDNDICIFINHLKLNIGCKTLKRIIT
jgi:hypothetical protein